MDVSTIKNFIKFLKESRYNEFSMRDGGVTLKVKFEPERKNDRRIHGIDTVTKNKAEEKKEAGEKETAAGKANDEFVKIITSPIVGRFYSTMTADNLEPIRKGDLVRVNQKICMIEAMNIEHEISSPYSGIMEEMFVDDGTPVMYGQPLFKVRTN